jgi:hypothetical protein
VPNGQNMAPILLLFNDSASTSEIINVRCNERTVVCGEVAGTGRRAKEVGRDLFQGAVPLFAWAGLEWPLLH